MPMIPPGSLGPPTMRTRVSGPRTETTKPKELGAKKPTTARGRPGSVRRPGPHDLGDRMAVAADHPGPATGTMTLVNGSVPDGPQQHAPVPVHIRLRRPRPPALAVPFAMTSDARVVPSARWMSSLRKLAHAGARSSANELPLWISANTCSADTIPSPVVVRSRQMMSAPTVHHRASTAFSQAFGYSVTDGDAVESDPRCRADRPPDQGCSCGCRPLPTSHH